VIGHEPRRVLRMDGKFTASMLFTAANLGAGCAAPPPSLSSNSPCAPVVVERLHFKMTYASGTVGEAEWRAFAEIAAACKREYGQEAVLVVRTHAEACF
jgi:hypothetical protein